MVKTARFLFYLFLLCLIPLIFGIESVLMIELPGDLPLGTLLATIVFISASLIPLLVSTSGSVFRYLSLILLFISILWLPLGIYYSGNAALNFVNDATDAYFFWRFTTGLGILVFAGLLWSGVKHLKKNIDKRPNLRHHE